MADEETTPTPDDAAEATSAPEAPPADEAVPEPAADASASEANAASDSAPQAPSEAAPQAPSEPQEVLAPKERRQRERSAKAAAQPTRPQRSAEERQAERDAERKRKAEIRRKRRVHDRERAKGRRGPTPEPLPALRDKHPGQQKTRQGVVVSDKASKTIVVRIDVTRRHPFYEKVVRTSTTLHAHDEREDANIGDTVLLRESRPLSRTKRWRLERIVERAG